MQTSVIYPHNKTKLGFTLIEILVVLVIVSLLAGITIPNLYKMAQGVEIASQRTFILNEIQNLGYRAYITGIPIQLNRQINEEKDNEQIFHLPTGWQLKTSHPILYTFNGFCSGGDIILISPDKRQEKIQLDPPRCLVSFVNSD